MTLWTIIPHEVVFGSEEWMPEYQEVEVDGRIVLVEKTGFKQLRIIKIVSTCPEDFLRPEFQPGSPLHWHFSTTQIM